MKVWLILLVITAIFGGAVQVFSAGDRLRLLSYNVENLFHPSWSDPYDDPTYLPRLLKPAFLSRCPRRGEHRVLCRTLDYSLKIYRERLRRIGQTLAMLRPDVAVLVEVENREVVLDLIRESRLPLSLIGITSGGDSRGINIAVLSNFPALSPCTSHIGVPTSRPILKCRLKTDTGAPLTIIGNHWPSLQKETEERVRMARLLRSLIIDDPASVALGDFNTLDSEFPNPIRDQLPMMVDVEHRLLTDLSIPFDPRRMPTGSFYDAYAKMWKRLDRILVHQSLWPRVVAESFQTVREPMLLEPQILKGRSYSVKESIPRAAFRIERNRAVLNGVSDHLPVMVELRKSPVEAQRPVSQSSQP